MTAPICDEHPEHGPMKADHIYKLDGTIDTRFGMYWFCQYLGCSGYGGRVEGTSGTKPKGEQLSMFEREEG